MTFATSTVWKDARGYSRIGLIYTPTGIGGILPALEACSNAGALVCWEGPLTVIGAAPAAALYESGLQVAGLTYICADGTDVMLLIFAPILAVFMADGATIDATNALIVALNAAVIGHMTNASGSLVIAYASGRLIPGGAK